MENKLKTNQKVELEVNGFSINYDALSALTGCDFGTGEFVVYKDEAYRQLFNDLGLLGTYKGISYAQCIVDSITDIKVYENTTVVWFKDGDKQVATVQEGDVFDLEEGLVICMMKHIIGSSNYGKLGSLAVKKYKKIQEDEAKRIKKNEEHKEQARRKREKKEKYKQNRRENRINEIAEAIKRAR